MKVAHVTTVDLSLRYLIFSQLTSIVDRGGNAIGISSPGPWVSDLEAAGIRHIPLPSSTRGIAPLADLKAALELWRVIRRERPDILHTHNPKPGIYGRILGRLARVPIVINTVHGLYATPDDPLTKRVVVYLMEAIASRFSDAELVQSQEDLQLINRLRIAPRGRASFLGNGVELNRFRPAHRGERDLIRASLGLNDGEIAVGAVGRLVAEKGFLELFEAARLLSDNFVVLAVGPEDPEKPDALTTAEMEDARRIGIRFLGMRTDIAEIYRALDIFVLPSHREGFPRSAMEAAATGLPVIATDIRGCREVVVDGENGLLVPVGDPARLAAAITEIGLDPQKGHLMGLAGIERARNHFDENAIVERVLTAYRKTALAKGLDELAHKLEPGMRSTTIRTATPDDVRMLARLHLSNIDSGFLSSLGTAFLEELYRALVIWPEAVVLVADGGSGPIGFVAGVRDTSSFYKHFLVRRGARAGLSALPRLVRPSQVRKAWETLNYRGNRVTSSPSAELLALAVHSNWRGHGLGTDLGSLLLEKFADAQAEAVKVVVGADNVTAIKAYERMGFQESSTIEVHRGARSLVMTWRKDSTS